MDATAQTVSTDTDAVMEEKESLRPSYTTMSKYTEKAAMYDTFRFPSPGMDVICKALAVEPGLTVLDLGCGSGAFLPNIVNACKPGELVAIDPNQAMVIQALERVKKQPLAVEKLDIRSAGVQELEATKYDVVFCAQVLQNLTTIPESAMAKRKNFLSEIYRILKPGGKAVVTTRFVPPGGRWSDLYWYADPAVVPNAVQLMETMVPKAPLDELKDVGFVECQMASSGDTVVRSDAFLDPRHLDNPAFRAADSFFQHVDENELAALLKNRSDHEKAGTLEQYVKERNALRNNNGHVVCLIGHKK